MPYSKERQKAIKFKNMINQITLSHSAQLKIEPYEIVFEVRGNQKSNIGVVIPLYNYQDFVVEALESIKSQSIDRFDLVIVDDCSTDDSLQIVLNWIIENASRFVNCAILKNKRNSKSSATRNVGFNYLQTKWIMPLDPDNLLLPNCLEECQKVIEESAASVVYPRIELFGDNKLILSDYHTSEISVGEWDPYKLANGNYIDAMALIDKAAWLKVGGYDNTMIYGWEDYDLWLKFIENGFYGINIPKVLAKYRVHGKSLTRTVTNKDIELRRKEIIDRHPWISTILNQKIENLNLEITTLKEKYDKEIRNREQIIENLTKEKDAEIENLHLTLASRESYIKDIENKHNSEIKDLQSALNSKEIYIKDIENKYNELNNQLKSVPNSHSWRFSKPLRLTGKFARWFTVGTQAWLTFAPGSRPRRISKKVLLWAMNKVSANPTLKAWAIILFNKFLRLKQRLKNIYFSQFDTKDDYETWIKNNEPKPKELESQKNMTFSYAPTISIIVPAYNTPEMFLVEMIESVLSQTYSNWELAIADANNKAFVREILEKYSQKNPRIKVKFLNSNKGIAGNSNEALSLANGDYVAFLDHDDTLAPFALFEVVKRINEDPEANFMFSDEDEISVDGTARLNPHFKPDWSSDMLRSYNYISHLIVLKRKLVERISPLRENYEGADFYDLILRATEAAKDIVHIPKVLYHRRETNPVLAESTPSDSYMLRDGKELKRRLLKNAPSGERRPGDEQQFALSLIILTKNSPEYIIPLLESLNTPKLGNCYEVVVGDTGTTDMEVLKYYSKTPRGIKIVNGLKYHFGMNYNQLVRDYARGKVVGIMNNDIILPGTAFFREIEGALSNDEVGVVGTKLLYKEGRLQHGGVYFMEKGKYKGLPYHRLHGEYPGKLPAVGSEVVPAVTGAFLFCRREDFLTLGGFDENYKEEAQDIDLCLKFRRAGKQVLFLNVDNIIHLENGTRPKGSENWGDRNYFMWKWKSFLESAVLGSEMNKDTWRK